MQATNEEFEATNEELETNNEELQATNEELQTTNDELTARTTEMQELSKQHRMQQVQLSTLLERYPHYVMVLNAQDLTIETANPGYKQLFGDRDITGLPASEVFSGKDVDQLLKLIKTAVREGQAANTKAIHAGVVGDDGSQTFIHTIVPITDESGGNANRVFIYSEKSS